MNVDTMSSIEWAVQISVELAPFFKRNFFPSIIHCPLSSLTSTDAPGHGHIVAIITLQPFVVVAGPRGAAVLVKLCSTHLAAPTSIWHSANSWRANQGLVRALTHCWAASSHLEGWGKEQRGRSHRQTRHKWSESCNIFFLQLRKERKKELHAESCSNSIRDLQCSFWKGFSPSWQI